MVSTVRLSLATASKISFRRCKNFKTGKTLRIDDSIMLTPRSSTSSWQELY